jgi:DMSO/TMAO reductase YedYZ heme-binding membrane subunit
MLTASVLIGIVVASDLFWQRRRPRWLLDLHRGLAGLTLAFVGLHLLALLGDSYLELDLADLLVPFAASWRRGAVGLGVLGFWGLVAIQTTSAMMHRLPRRWWRAVHLGSYPVFAMVALHGTLAGTDAARGWYVAGTTLALAAVMAGGIYRILQRRSRQAALADRGRLGRTAGTGR